MDNVLNRLIFIIVLSEDYNFMSLPASHPGFAGGYLFFSFSSFSPAGCLLLILEKDHLLLVDVPGAKRHYNIPRLPVFEEIILDSLKSRDIHA